MLQSLSELHVWNKSFHVTFKVNRKQRFWKKNFGHYSKPFKSCLCEKKVSGIFLFNVSVSLHWIAHIYGNLFHVPSTKTRCKGGLQPRAVQNISDTLFSTSCSLPLVRAIYILSMWLPFPLVFKIASIFEKSIVTINNLPKHLQPWRWRQQKTVQNFQHHENPVYIKKQTPWFQSASELYRPSDRRSSAKFSANSCG
jgi:hypothetical protein